MVLTSSDFKNEPSHSTKLNVHDQEPYNAEPDVATLIQHSITPEELVYCRNHGPVKALDDNSFPLVVNGLVRTPIQLSLRQVRTKFERVELIAVLQCAGNRRSVMKARTGRETEGIQWGEGTLSNNRWAGVRLRDVIVRAGLTESSVVQYVCFASHVTECQQDSWYGASIPLAQVMDAEREVILAYEMNGKPLSPDHGSPFRVVIPGVTGARWVKWVDTITISATESRNFYQQKDYKVLPSEVLTHEQVDKEDWWSKVPAILSNCLHSVVASCEPISSDSRLVLAKGYAVPAGAGSPICRVQVSGDQGTTWTDAHLTYRGGKWGWTLWESEVNVCSSKTVLCRAWDEAGTMQKQEDDWNLRGVAYSAWGKMAV